MTVGLEIGAPDFGGPGHPSAVAAAVCREAVARFGADVAYVVRHLDSEHVVLESREPVSTVMPPGKTYAVSELADLELASGSKATRLPITIHGLTRRVLVLQRSSDHPVSDREALLLQRFADQAGLALEHADLRRAEEEAKQNTRQTHRLLGVSAALAAARTVQDVAAAILAQGRMHMGAAAATVLVADGNSLRVLASEPPDAAVGEHMQTVPSTGVVLAAASASVPLTAGAAVVGSVELSFGEEREFDSSDREFLAAFGRQGGLALERARLHADEVRAREEAELRASAAQALEFIAEGVFMVDNEGVVRVWNPMTAAVTALSAQEAVGRTISNVLYGWDDFVERVPVARAGDGGMTPLTLPFETGRGEVWISISGIRFDDGLVYAFRDVTDEHGLDRLKSDFIATISHELRTPLAVLYGGAATLGREDVDISAEDRRQMLEMMVAEGKRLERLVDRILFASSLETDTVRSESGLFDASELVDDVVAEIGATIGAGIELSIQRDVEHGLVLGDRDHLRQIVWNLVDNAVKYSSEGGAIDVTVELVSGRLHIGVADDGRGVAPSERERIFDKFYRADSQLTTGVRGTGLGLYIVRELVQRMGGNVWVEPRASGGSIFVVELPVNAAAAVEPVQR